MIFALDTGIGGRVLPVFDTRARCGLPQRSIEPADHLLIARTGNRQVVLVIDMLHESLRAG